MTETLETLMAELDTAIGSFRPETHDPENSNSAWNKIRLAARSLAFQYYTETICREKIDCTERQRVIERLDRAKKTIPEDLPKVIDCIEEHRKTVLSMPTEIFNMQNPEYDDNDD